MYKIAKLSKRDRQELIIATASKMKVAEAIVEKDFWVCWTLDYLFHESQWKEHFAFKGGTSLSKCFNLIDRFSEDIDLILDWRILECAKKLEKAGAFAVVLELVPSASAEYITRNLKIPRHYS